MQAEKKGNRTRRKRKDKEISLSKTKEWGQAIDSEHLSQTEEELEVNFFQSRIKGFAKLDYKYFRPFFTRRFTQQVCIISIHRKITSQKNYVSKLFAPNDLLIKLLSSLIFF